MDELRFDGRVAVVTGAGRGIGAAYSRLLAARGATVVVNDRGTAMSGEGADGGPARTVVADITSRGGTAVADGNDVAEVEGAEALVGTAIERFGRVDVLVNNAGIMRWADMPAVDADAMEAHFAVHTLGSFLTARAAWPYMVAQQHGRIVMTTSSGVLGLRGNVAYATAKGGVIGLARSLATSGAAHGITVNCIAPAAYTRMAGSGDEPNVDDPTATRMAPDLVAPMVAVLAHDSCSVTGEIYTAGSGRFARLFIASTEGYAHGSGAPTPEDVVAHWDAINDESGYFVPTDLLEWSARFTAP